MEPPIQARNLIVCREVVHRPHDIEAPYSLHGVLCRMRPPDDFGYPVCAESLCVYAELYGEPGLHRTRIVLVKIDDEEAVPAPPVAVFSWTMARVRPGAFVDGTKWLLPQVPFDTPGVYEFRLTLDGFDEPLVAVRLFLMEV